LLVWRNADAVCVVQIIRNLDPFLSARSQIQNFPNHRSWDWWISVRSKNCGVCAAIRGHYDIIYASHKFLPVAVGIPAPQLFAVQVELEDSAGIVGAREQKCFLFRQRQSVMAATLGMIQHRGRFSVPL